MISLTYAVFLAGVVSQVVASVAALGYLTSTQDRRLLNFASRLTLFAALCLAGTLLLRTLLWKQVPFTTAFDSLVLFALMLSSAMFVICLSEARRALLAFYLPAASLICLLAALLSITQLASAPPQKDISQTLLIVHVVLAFQAYALFFIASLTSMAYAYLAGRLKKHKAVPVLQHKLPSLENLDLALYRLIATGYPLFVITLGLGLYWARRDPSALSQTWWFSPKILLSLLMVIFYGVSFHGRALGRLRGPKLAHFVFFGFGSLLAIYLLLNVFNVKDYNFWSAAQ